jgi:phytanoyl-CoA hydroxylase
MLTTEQQQQYQRDGYLILPNVKTASEMSVLRARASAIVDAFDPRDNIAIFSTDQQKHRIETYFMESANKVCCFFEEEAFGPNVQLKQAKSLSINKIGHAMHDLDPVFADFSRTGVLAALACDIGLTAPQIWQSMYIFKQPGIGGEVRWHQDATYFETDPITVTTFWFALEDANLDNGCLWVEPGGHRSPLRERFVATDGKAKIEILDTTPWPDKATAVPVEVRAGTLVMFHGLLPHYSAPNRSALSRHAYTIHVTDGQSRYAKGNWIQRDASMPVRGFE